MSIQSGMVSLLTGESTISTLVSTRVYIEHAPQGATYPLILISQIDSDEFHALDGSGKFRAVTFDIDCKDTRSVNADALSEAVRTFIKDYTGAAGDETITAVLLNGEQTDYEPPTDGSDRGVYVNNLDLTIQYSPA